MSRNKKSIVLDAGRIREEGQPIRYAEWEGDV